MPLTSLNRPAAFETCFHIVREERKKSKIAFDTDAPCHAHTHETVETVAVFFESICMNACIEVGSADRKPAVYLSLFGFVE
jgi:hypothetical protein